MGLFDVLTAVGGLGVDLAASAVKVTGKLAAEGAKCALGSGGLKLTESSESTLHDYTDWTLDTVTSDRDYMSMFKCAVEELVKRRSYDDYIGDIARWTRCEPYSACVLGIGTGDDAARVVVWELTFMGIQVLDDVTNGVRDVSRCVRIRVRTPNAMQLTWNGDALQKGYGISVSDRRGEVCRQVPAEDVSFDSFLGVAFRHNYREFSVDNQEMLRYLGEVGSLKDVAVVNVKANSFLSFNKYQAIVPISKLVPDWKDKVVGVTCSVCVSAVGDVEEFMKKVRAILKHKYRGEWTQKDMSGLFELGSRFQYVMHIKGGMLYLSQSKAEEIELTVVADEYDEYRSDVDAAYMDTEEYKKKVAAEKEKELERSRAAAARKAEIENKEKAKKEEEALKTKKREEELAAKKAELSNALNAL